MKRKILQILLLGIIIAFGGCYSLTTYENADTIRPGKIAGGVGFSIYQVSSKTGADTVANDFLNDWKIMELFFRYGINDNMDLGFKLYSTNLSLDYKWRFLDLGLFKAAINFGGVYSSLFKIDGWGAFGNFIFDIRPTDAISIYFGPKYMYTHYNLSSDFSGDGAPSNYYGGFLGLKIKLKGIALMLELNAYKVAFDMKDASLSTDEGFFWQPGIAVQFGY